jgi:hypothetical protein
LASCPADGRREVLGFALDDSEYGAFWTTFLRSLKARGLALHHSAGRDRVDLEASDAERAARRIVDVDPAGPLSAAF